jgi:hypothetical protein
MDVSSELHTPAALPPGERAPGTHRIGGWVAHESVWTLWRREKSLYRESNHDCSVVQPVA